MTNKESIKAEFFEYVKYLSEKNNLDEAFKEFDCLFTQEKDYRLAFVYYTKILRKNESLINKKLEGDFFAEYIW